MRKLMLALLALIAIVTFIRAFDMVIETEAAKKTIVLEEEVLSSEPALPSEAVDFLEN